MALIARLAGSVAAKLVRPTFVPATARAVATTVTARAAMADNATVEAATTTGTGTGTVMKAVRIAKAGIAKTGRAVQVLIVLLSVDYFWHEDDDIISWRMAHKLRTYKPPAPPTNPVKVEPIVLVPDQINVVAGPAGCGKSAALHTLAREYAEKGTPVILIRFPRPPSGTGTFAAATSEEVARVFGNMATSVYTQIGFPQRRALMLQLWDLMSGVDRSSPVDVSNRLSAAFCLLVNVACDIGTARKADAAAKAAPVPEHPVLLFDDVDNLVTDNRLAAAGGAACLRRLGTLLVIAAVDNADSEKITAAVAGGSFRLRSAMPFGGNRYSAVVVQDPAPDDVKAALAARGYTPDEADRMLRLCGPRLRLLDGPLKDAKHEAVADFEAAAWSKADANIWEARRGFHTAGRSMKEFCALMDRVAAAHAGGARVKDDETLTGVELTSALYTDEYTSLWFQSDLHRQVWQADRQKYTGVGPT